MSNPYASPAPAPTVPTTRLAVKWHRLAWQVPLVGLAITVVLNSSGRALGLGLVGLIIFLASIVLGWIITCIVAVQVWSGRGKHGNLLGGLVTNAVLTLLVAFSFHAVSLARQAAIDARGRAAAESQRRSAASEPAEVQSVRP